MDDHSQTIRPDRYEQRTVIAQDPTIQKDGKVILDKVWIPVEARAPGPKGHRFEVIDYDASTQQAYVPAPDDLDDKQFVEEASDPERLLKDPRIHSWNVYAVAMSTLGQFERALGRPVEWGVGYNSHHIKLVPHAFEDLNAYYSRDVHSLLFGYFFAEDGPCFTCLSRDVITHETTHAILDGLRPYYREPTTLDQIAFHEGFADTVALLSVLTSEALIEKALGVDVAGPIDWREKITTITGEGSFLFGVAEQVGGILKRGRDGIIQEEQANPLQKVRGNPLRASYDIPPDQARLSSANSESEYGQPHKRGEILVAAMMRAFMSIWDARIPRTKDNQFCDRRRAIEEGAKAAQHLLTIAIRAIDYLPPVRLLLSDYLRALLTADYEICPNDKYGYRTEILKWFAKYGMVEIEGVEQRTPGSWYWESSVHEAAQRQKEKKELPSLVYGVVHNEALRSSPEAAYRWVWENMDALGLVREAFSRVLSVRPITRIGPDGVLLKETTIELLQTVILKPSELAKIDPALRAPDDMPHDIDIKLYGGNTLIFDEFGQLKYNVGISISAAAQNKRIEELWKAGHYDSSQDSSQPFAEVHRMRAFGSTATQSQLQRERWN